jgi:hypothetical protein
VTLRRWGGRVEWKTCGRKSSSAENPGKSSEKAASRQEVQNN